MSVSPFDHPLLSALLGDDEVAECFLFAAELDAMLAFERALARAEADLGVIPREASRAIDVGIARFSPDLNALRRATARDGLPVPELVKQLRIAIGELHAASLHFGATSQDVVDTALILRLKRALAILEARLQSIARDLAQLQQRFGSHQIPGITRMQVAIPITATDRIAAWRGPLERHAVRLREQLPRLLVVQFGGAAGTLDVLGETGPTVRAALARELGLGDAPQWHSQRDTIADLAGWLSLVTGSLGKIGQDIALMALGGTIQLSGGGGSSAMPHKQNPVKAEMLETLARFNSVQVGAMHQAMLHPMERSGAAWTLEWLILPQMVVATAAALRLAIALIGEIGDMST